MHFFDGKAIILVVLPVIGLLASVVFRVDEYAFTSRRKEAKEQRPRFANFHSEEGVMADPDGKIPQRPRKQPRQLIRDRVNAAGSLTTQR